MALQYSVGVRNAKLDAVEVSIGVAPELHIRSGLPPANCAAPSQGTLLMIMALPSDWMAVAAAGVKGKNGTWSGVGIANGTAGHFRIVNGSPSEDCQVQGLIETQGGSPTGDMGLDNTSIAVSQAASVTSFNLTAGNA